MSKSVLRVLGVMLFAVLLLLFAFGLLRPVTPHRTPARISCVEWVA